MKPEITLRLAVLAVVCLLWQGAIAAGPRLACQSSVYSGYSVEKIKQLIAEKAETDPLAGIWQSTDGGGIVAIIPETYPGNPDPAGGGYTMIIIEAPSPEISPGTVMGSILPTAKSGTFDATLYTSINRSALSDPKRFTMVLSGGNHLSITRVHDGVEIVPWKLLPYMFRPLLRERRDRQKGLDGFLRLWPVTPQAPPIAPRKL